MWDTCLSYHRDPSLPFGFLMRWSEESQGKNWIISLSCFFFLHLESKCCTVSKSNIEDSFSSETWDFRGIFSYKWQGRFWHHVYSVEWDWRGENRNCSNCVVNISVWSLLSSVLSSLDIKIVPFQSKLWSVLSQQFSQFVWEYEDTVDCDYDEVSSALNYISSARAIWVRFSQLVAM